MKYITGDNSVNCSSPEGRNKDMENGLVGPEEKTVKMEGNVRWAEDGPTLRNGLIVSLNQRNSRSKKWLFIDFEIGIWIWHMVILGFRCYIKVW